MKVPFVDLKRQYFELETAIDKATKDVLLSGQYTNGPKNREFEQLFAAYCGKKYAVSCANGTSALHLALLGLNIGKGDNVIVPVNTFAATAEAVIHAGATPVWIDVTKNTHTLDVDCLERTINFTSPTPKAIIPVHLYGHPAEMHDILNLAEEYDLEVIEDCSQAHGAELDGEKMPFGFTGTFSFYPTKNLGSFGEGGIIVTDLERVAERAKKLRVHGHLGSYAHAEVGYNYKLGELEAAMLSIKLGKLDEWNERRRGIAQKYNTSIKNPHITLPPEDPWAKHVYHVYVIKSNERNELRHHLENNGVEALIHYPITLNLQQAFSSFSKDKRFPIGERLRQQVLSLPLHPHMTTDEVDYVIDQINRYKQ